ncbi:MAG: hypothetical protein H6627_02770 [Calditrichae bacterium]|nr:hypothetical protein [Calditrichia bacterium]
MYSKMKSILIVSVFLLALAMTVFAQDADIFIDPQKSDPTMKRIVIIGANQVSTDVTNYGTIGRGNDSDVASGGGGVWPRGTGHDHIHEMTGFIGARVKDKSGKYVYIISDGYRDPGGAGSEIDPVTNIQYAFQPLAGYLNDLQDDIANSLNPNSWPFSWPGKDATWDGKWNGYFGLNQFNADQEVVYVMDDAYNKEFQFYPYPEDSSRRGLGVQVETRLFQWAHPLAKDIIFIHYQVSNAGSHDYNVSSDSIFFGGYGDIGVGGRGSRDDDAAFDASQDLVYGWDHDNIGVWQKFREIPPGYIGWKFLESPGIDNDGIDNDDDGLTDESRSNTVVPGESMIFGPVGIYGEPKEHFAADEDGDWNVTLHDVGKDGSGPLDEGYPGPDEGEGNGIPDQGEPNFGRLDNDESDQVGLTSFTAPLFGSVLVTDEDNMWSRIQPGYFTVPQQNVNQYWIFGSGPFNLAPRETERFSTCFVFGLDEISLFQTSRVAQRIYDSDYRFAKPPRQPKLKAIAGDGKVTLIWDDLAEFSRDPVYGQDFEGYRIYKSTEPNFLEPDDITDSRGNPVFKKPIAQFDLANGLTGPHPLQFGQEIDAPVGIHYYMGDDTGLQHYFIDTDVINGRTYYYAVTAYDKGYDVDFYDRGLSDTELLFPITPSESPASITLQGGEIKTMDPNTAVVTPNPFPLDLAPGSADVEGVLNHEEGVSTGSVSIEIISAELLKDADYKVSFTTVPGATVIEPVTSAFTLVNETLNDTIVNQQALPRNPANGVYNNEWSQEFLDEGFVLFFNNQYPYFDKFIPENSDTESYWAEDAQTNMTFTLNPEVVEPVSFVVEFGDTNAILDSAFTNNAGTQNIKTNFTVYEYGTGERLQCYIKEKNDNGRLDVEGEWFGLVYKRDPSRTIYNRSWICFLAGATDEAGNPLPESEWITPQSGDKFYVINKIPFTEKDAFKFKTIQPAKIENLSENSLKKIRVVPNPYVVSSIFEKQPSLSGRGERFIRFINLPSECEVRIYTVNGFPVRKLQHSGEENGTLRWDLLSKDGLEVAFGLYIYHVDAPGIGEYIGKFVIIN